MIRKISILLITAASLLSFTGASGATPSLTPQQEMWLQSELSFGPFKYVPHPAGPKSEDFIDVVSGVHVQSKRDIGDFAANFLLDTIIKPAEMDAGILKSVNNQSFSGNPQDKPGPQRAPPRFSPIDQLR